MRAFVERIAGNSILLLFSRVLSKVATVVTIALVARVLKPELFGQYSSITALTIFAGLVSDFGLVTPTIRSISIEPHNAPVFVGRTLAARTFWSLIGIALILVLGGGLGFDGLLLACFCAASILEAVTTGLVRTFEAAQEFRIVTKLNILERVVYFLSVAVSLFFAGSIVGIALAVLFSYSVILAVVYHRFKKRFGGITVRIDVGELIEYSRMGFPFVVIALASAAYYKADTLVMNRCSTSLDVGIYNAALRVTDAQMFIPMTLMAVVFPSIARAHGLRAPKLRDELLRSLLLFAGIGFVIAGCIFLGAPLIINLLFSRQFSPAADVLRILSLMVFFYYIYFCLGNFLMAIHKEFLFTIGMLAVACGTIILDVLFIPKFGYIAAAWLRVLGDFLLSAVLTISFLKHIPKNGGNQTSTAAISPNPPSAMPDSF